MVITAHCLINQNAVIREWERAEGAFTNVIMRVMEKGYGLIQLPCPEFRYMGEARPPMSLEEYDTDAYRKHCRNLLMPVLKDIKEYLSKGYVIKGLLGIQESPSCDSKLEPGIFMQEFFKILESEKIMVEQWDVPEDYLEGKEHASIKDLEKLLQS